jgi:acyl-CoA hydrolase
LVCHLDHSEHSVQVIVTEQGVADLRGKSPHQRAEAIISNCAHPDYRTLLRDYVHLGGNCHSPQTLPAAFGMHRTFSDTGDMRATAWESYLK